VAANGKGDPAQTGIPLLFDSAVKSIQIQVDDLARF
jgi:hypothetical protein